MVNHQRLVANQLIEFVHLLLVALLQELQLHHFLGRELLRVVLVLQLHCPRQPLARGLQSADRATRREHPLLMALTGLPVSRRSDLLGELRGQRVDDVDEVVLAQPRIAIGQHRQPDDDIRVCEFRGSGGYIFANKGHPQLQPRPRHMRVDCQSCFAVFHAQEAEGNSVNFREAVGQEGAQPVVTQVQQFLVHGRCDMRDDFGRQRHLLQERQLVLHTLHILEKQQMGVQINLIARFLGQLSSVQVQPTHRHRCVSAAVGSNELLLCVLVHSLLLLLLLLLTRRAYSKRSLHATRLIQLLEGRVRRLQLFDAVLHGHVQQSVLFRHLL
mmetsp:Transcript_12330/g.20472  ORF Transcript_12330/g.20472 Transcript_12330/m.20472 type:complete len:328 (-) Transcript_12330:858-1841(-)